MGEAGRGARGGGCRAAGLGLQPMQSPHWGLLQGRGQGSRPPVGTGVAGVPAVSTSDAHLPPPALAGASWPLCSSAVSQQTLPGLSGWHCRNETGAGGSKRGPCHRQRPARGGLGRVAGGCYSDLADPTCSPRMRCPASLPHLLGEGLGPWEVSARSEVTEPLSSVNLPATSAPSPRCFPPAACLWVSAWRPHVAVSHSHPELSRAKAPFLELGSRGDALRGTRDRRHVTGVPPNTEPDLERQPGVTHRAAGNEDRCAGKLCGDFRLASVHYF